MDDNYEYDVFLSYSRADSQIANQIYEALLAAKLKVFFDRSSIGSESFIEKIVKGVKSAKLLLFLASRNSISSNYAPDEMVFAKNNKPRNSIIIYDIDNVTYPDEMELLFASLNRRNARVDSINVIIDDIFQLLSQGEISRIPKVTKGIDYNAAFDELYGKYSCLDFYSVIHHEITGRYWENNWNHHLLLMRIYALVGDRMNYGALLQAYQKSGIRYYPQFYNITSQIWDMIKMGFVDEAESHVCNLAKEIKTPLDRICSDINYTHILLLDGNCQNAVNNYNDICIRLTPEERYLYLFKDFDTIRWIGCNQLSNNNIVGACNILGYPLRHIYTSAQSTALCQGYEQRLLFKKWHFREERVHIVLSFIKYNGVGNAVYYFEERDKNLLGKIFNVLPFGLDEGDSILNAGRAFSQFRLSMDNGRLILEEFNPVTEQIGVGEIVRLTDDDLHIKILDNGIPSSTGTVRKYKSIR